MLSVIDIIQVGCTSYSSNHIPVLSAGEHSRPDNRANNHDALKLMIIPQSTTHSDSSQDFS